MITPLQTTNLGSMCCGARIIDPGNTGEGLCSECKEHTSRGMIQEIDIAILDFANSGNVYIHRIEYDNTILSDEYDDIGSFIQRWLNKKYGNPDNLEYMRNVAEPIKVFDDRKGLETKEE